MRALNEWILAVPVEDEVVPHYEVSRVVSSNRFNEGIKVLHIRNCRYKISRNQEEFLLLHQDEVIALIPE